MQIDQSPARRDLVRRNQSGRHRQIAEVRHAGPPDVFQPAPLMQRMLKLLQPTAQLLVLRVAAPGIIPAAELRKQIIGRTQLRLPNPDLRLQLLLLRPEPVNRGQLRIPVGTLGKTVFEPLVNYHYRGPRNLTPATALAAPESGGRDLVFPETGRHLKRHRLRPQRTEKTERQLLKLLRAEPARRNGGLRLFQFRALLIIEQIQFEFFVHVSAAFRFGFRSVLTYHHPDTFSTPRF